jgi:hypothetical protein
VITDKVAAVTSEPLNANTTLPANGGLRCVLLGVPGPSGVVDVELLDCESASGQRRFAVTPDALIPATRTLWRPVGRNELRLIEQAGYRAFPPRLPEQPIFYPVLNFDYAEQIARDWNSKDERHANVGFVTEFNVRSDFIDGYEPHQVGGRTHIEYWIPAEQLPLFNDAIVDEILVVAEYRNGERVA